LPLLAPDLPLLQPDLILLLPDWLFLQTNYYSFFKMVVPDSYQNIVQASLLEQAVAGIASYDPTELDRAGLKINILSALNQLTWRTPTHQLF
jgi:hypothetical protein